MLEPFNSWICRPTYGHDLEKWLLNTYSTFRVDLEVNMFVKYSVTMNHMAKSSWTQHECGRSYRFFRAAVKTGAIQVPRVTWDSWPPKRKSMAPTTRLSSCPRQEAGSGDVLRKMSWYSMHCMCFVDLKVIVMTCNDNHLRIISIYMDIYICIYNIYIYLYKFNIYIYNLM